MESLLYIFPSIQKRTEGKQTLEHMKLLKIQIIQPVLIGSFWRQKKSSFSLVSICIIRQQPGFSKISTKEYGRSYEEWRKRRQERRRVRAMRTKEKQEHQILVGDDGEHRKELWERRKEKAVVFLLRRAYLPPRNISEIGICLAINGI